MQLSLLTVPLSIASEEMAEMIVTSRGPTRYGFLKPLHYFSLRN